MNRKVVTAAAATRVAAVAAWAAIVSGPLLGAMALLSDQAAIPQRDGGHEAAMERSGLGPGDFAVRYVAAWIGAEQGDEELIRSFYPNAPELPARATLRTNGVLRVASASEVDPGYWSLTVSGAVTAYDGQTWRSPVTRFWRVGVAVLGDAATGGTAQIAQTAAYVATSLPSEIPMPDTAEEPESGYGSEVTGAPGVVGDSVQSFVRLYLTGRPGLERYVSPGAVIQPLRPAAYIDAEVVAMRAAGGSEMADLTDLSSSAPPEDGERLRVLATVRPYTDAGDGPLLQYALTLSARAGRWEIAALDAAPLLADQPEQHPDGAAKEGEPR